MNKKRLQKKKVEINLPNKVRTEKEESGNVVFFCMLEVSPVTSVCEFVGVCVTLYACGRYYECVCVCVGTVSVCESISQVTVVLRKAWA